MAESHPLTESFNSHMVSMGMYKVSIMCQAYTVLHLILGTTFEVETDVDEETKWEEISDALASLELS